MNDLKYNEVEGYKFIKIGEAVLADTPLNAKGISDNYRLSLKLIDNEFINAEQSAYLVYEGDKLIYVGYYSGSFKARWLREQNDNFYFWHSDNVDNYVNKLLIDQTSAVTVWLSVYPYAKIADGKDVNISKLIEDEIIMKKQPKLNKVGKDLASNKKDTEPVQEILNRLI